MNPCLLQIVAMVVVTKEPYGETEPLCWSPIKKNISDDDYVAGETPTVEHAYRNITSSMQADPLEISSPKLALDLLSTAVRLQNMPLVKQCIEIIDKQLDPSILISVMSRLSECTSQRRDNYEPSAPPIIESENRGNIDWVVNQIENLRHNCLLEIDRYADAILKDLFFSTLPYMDVLRITTRDSLQVSSETIVYSAIMKWAHAECYRRTLQPHLTNLKAVLRDLVHAPRYGLMTKKEFTSRKIDGEKGPTRSGILEEKEWRRILFFIKEKSKKRPVEELPFYCSRPRGRGCEKPKLLSSESARRASDCTTKDLECSTSNRCETIFLNIVTCWATIFD
ncbi:BTB/POZ domain-containing protein 2-like isoform X3 [Harmonia axyridis]|uniref:BTB/POZ domain-containing protein 2-like isoform X3 n=1 Tax=Harmonia axyridis TaxID=115357 RepID=UPI001E276D90|nr:BTB/POZ domain-containing protein 2-like isoform X3 [Harmonia axyridis]